MSRMNIMQRNVNNHNQQWINHNTSRTCSTLVDEVFLKATIRYLEQNKLSINWCGDFEHYCKLITKNITKRKVVVYTCKFWKYVICWGWPTFQLAGMNGGKSRFIFFWQWTSLTPSGYRWGLDFVHLVTLHFHLVFTLHDNILPQ